MENVSPYLRSAILGGVDGIVTSFAIVAGASFLSTSTTVVSVVGTSSLVADGVSMGISEYLSTKGEAQLTQSPKSSIRAGLVCCTAFIACGAVPLLTFTAGDGALLASSALALVALLLLGLGRTLVTGEVLLYGLLEFLGLGLLAAGVAFGVAAVSRQFVSE